jgi:nucleoid DNA-binding protein
MGYVLQKVTNPTSKVYNRWFAWTDYQGTLSSRGLAEYLIALGVRLDRATLEEIIVRIAQAIPEIVAQGYGVQLAGLGIFHATIANKKGGAATVKDFSIQEHIKGVRFHFRPSSTDLDNLTVKQFGKKVSFGNGYYKNESGAKAPKYPLNHEENPNP